MEFNEALLQISDIRSRIQRAQAPRTFKCITTSFTALLALAGTLIQDSLFGRSIDPASYLYFWSAVAALGLLVAGGEIYWRNQGEAPETRRLARELVSRFGIHLGAAAVLSYTLLQVIPSALGILPTLWALIFGLGLIAVEPLLNRRVRIAAAYYIIFALLNFATFGLQLNMWTMPLTFGIGQMLVAWALWQDSSKGNLGERL